jgi:Carboxypeptidase regulatory-like domain
MLRRMLSRACLLFVLPAITSAQGSGTISGTIADPSGAGIPSAKITITEVSTGISRTGFSGTEGYYLLNSLRPTEYVLSASAPGFRDFTQKGITLLADQSIALNVSLQLGVASETVTVDAKPPQVDITTATLRQVVDSQRMVELPLNGRNAAQLTTLVAGAVNAPNQNADQGPTKTFPAAVTISTNGSRQNWTAYLLDGVPNVDVLDGVNAPFPAPDALQEFSVQTSNYSAEFGESAGGVVNIVTKSGTNEFHGDAFGYLRNAVFNARNFFAASRDQLKRGQFGATLGGPVIHEKLFFFVEYQGTRIRNLQGGLHAFVPTAANDTGDFSSLLVANSPNNPQGKSISLKDPLTAQPFPGNLIPISRFDPASLNVMKLLPQATGNGLTFFTKPIQQNFDEALGRVDYSVSANDRLSGRFFWDRYIGVPVFSPANILAYTSGSTTPSDNAVVQEVHIFNPNLLNDLRLGYSRENISRGPAANVPRVTDFGVNITQGPAPGIEGMAATGYFSFGDYPQARFPRQTMSVDDDLRWVHGRHSVAFGAMYERDRFDQDNNYTRNGSFTFSGDTTGSGLADFALGKLRTFTQGGGQYAHNRLMLAGLYAQDNFRATRRLTLNYGMRWEPSLPWHDTLGKAEVFHPDLYAAGVHSQLYPLAPAGLLFPGDPGVPNDGVRGDWRNFAPRVGFAYDLFGTGKTSIRGGTGIFYESRTNGFANNRFAGVMPFSPQVTLTTPQGPFSNPYLGTTNPFLGFSGVPNKNTAFPTPVLAYTWDPGNKLVPPTAYNWNLTIEHQLRSDLMVRAAYVGMHGSHLNENIQLNPAVYIPGSSLATDQRRIFQGFTSMYEGSHSVNSRYNSFQFSVQKQLTHGFTVLANYTYSKATDNMALLTDATSLGANGAQVLPWYYPHSDAYEHGPSDFDRRQVFVVSYVWQLPALAHAKRAVRAVAGGWEVNGIIAAQTGPPLTITAGLDQSKTGIGYDRAMLVSANATVYGAGACGSTAPCVSYINPSAFALPAVGTFGNIGKGEFRSPGLFNWDMGLLKGFNFTERLRVQFRAEFFNATNRVNLSPPTGAVNSAGFGSVPSATDPRIGQLALKILF